MGKVVGPPCYLKRCRQVWHSRGDSGFYYMTKMIYDSEGSTLALKPRADIIRGVKWPEIVRSLKNKAKKMGGGGRFEKYQQVSGLTQECSPLCSTLPYMSMSLRYLCTVTIILTSQYQMSSQVKHKNHTFPNPQYILILDGNLC